MALLEIRGLRKYFGRLCAVNVAELDIGEGEITSVIGPNGAGKTTLFHLITGRFLPDAGTVKFKGGEIIGLPPYQIARKGISRSFQITSIFPALTVYENIKVAVLAGMERSGKIFSSNGRLSTVEEKVARIAGVLGLVEKSDLPAGILSHPDQKLVELGIVLATDAELLLLDEPTSGLSPKETDDMVSFLRDLVKRKGLTLVLTEHDMRVVFTISDRIIVLHQGEIIADGQPDAIQGNRSVREAYFGE